MRKVTWQDVQIGDTVYIDNYESGLYPSADPRISGPYIVCSPKAHLLISKGRRYDTKFAQYRRSLILEEYPCLTTKPSE